MGDLLIRNVPDSMKRRLALRAEEAGRSLSDEAKDILQMALIQLSETPKLAELSAWETLRPLLVADDHAEADEYAAIMEEIEAERKKDFGRPVDDLE
jgi:plasmid stability protein